MHYLVPLISVSIMMETALQLAREREVEALYADGVWYRGWLSYNFEKGK